MAVQGSDIHACFFCGKMTKRINLYYGVPSCGDKCDALLKKRMEGYDEVEKDIDDISEEL